MILCRWFTFSVRISRTKCESAHNLTIIPYLMLAVGQTMQRPTVRLCVCVMRGLHWVQHTHILKSLFHRIIMNFCVSVKYEYTYTHMPLKHSHAFSMPNIKRFRAFETNHEQKQSHINYSIDWGIRATEALIPIRQIFKNQSPPRIQWEMLREKGRERER